VQALVSPSFYAAPQRVTSGFDLKRLAVLLAVIERRVRLRLGRHEAFVTVTGGLRLDEPGTDLGVAVAVASSYLARPVLERTLLVGDAARLRARGGAGGPGGRGAGGGDGDRAGGDAAGVPGPRARSSRRGGGTRGARPARGRAAGRESGAGGR
jgi:hypothetical protein